MDADAMKMERDGQLSYGTPPTGLWALRGIFKLVCILPNGHKVTTDGGEGEIEWCSHSRVAGECACESGDDEKFRKLQEAYRPLEEKMRQKQLERSGGG